MIFNNDKVTIIDEDMGKHYNRLQFVNEIMKDIK